MFAMKSMSVCNDYVNSDEIIIELFDPTHMVSMTDPTVIGVETLRIDSWFFLEKEFTELIRINPKMILYLIVNQVDSCHNCVCGPST